MTGQGEVKGGVSYFTNAKQNAAYDLTAVFRKGFYRKLRVLYILGTK